MTLDHLLQAIQQTNLEEFQLFYSDLFSTYIIPVFFGFIVLEFLMGLFLRKPLYNYRESFIDLSLFIGKSIFEVITIGLVINIHLFFWQYRLLEFSVETLRELILVFILVDFIYYLVHLYGHKVKIGWATHVVHHSLQKINILSSVRQGWTNFLSLTWLVPIPFILLGIHPFLIEIGLGIVISYQFWLHTELIGRLGILEYLVNTPNLHRIHHSSQKEFKDKNLGGVLMIWDMIFKTYENNASDKKITYGVHNYNPNPKNPLSYIKEGLKYYRL